MQRVVNLILVFILFSAMSGCYSPPKAMYKGSVKPDQVVTLKLKDARKVGFGLIDMMSGRLKIRKVDDHWTRHPLIVLGSLTTIVEPETIFLDPGKHTVFLISQVGDWTSFSDLWFVGEPGRTYYVMKGRYCWIEDSTTGKRIGGFRGSDDEPKPQKERL